MKLASLKGRSVFVWGMGREGLAFARLAQSMGVEIVCIDDNPNMVSEADRELFGPVLLPNAADLESAGAIVRSPGVSRYRAELVAARERGVEVTTPFAIWLNDHANDAILAITGTKGKSTTATLAGLILEAAGYRVTLAGNIGVPVTDLYDRPASDIYVVEVSSYQAAEVTTSPAAVVLTSLAPDHLDWHGGVEQYYSDKLNLLRAGPAAKVAISAASEEALSHTEGFANRILFGPRGDVRVQDGWIVVNNERLLRHSNLRVPGVHNVMNLCGAIAGTMMITGRVPKAAEVEEALAHFDGLASRCERFGRFVGLDFVDDALASNPFAAASSLAAFPDGPLTIILGGANRGADRKVLEEAIMRRDPLPVVVVLPPAESELADAISRAARQASVDVKIISTSGIAAAVEVAASNTEPGGMVLFSPGAPTPPSEGTYADRSRRFKEAARGLKLKCK